ncbi:MAG: hypothetical protein AB1547_15285, partial [Thermodesulfobacteriota bacterium]
RTDGQTANRNWLNRNGLLFNEKSIGHVRPIQRSPAASNTFSQQSQKASPPPRSCPTFTKSMGKALFAAPSWMMESQKVLSTLI